MNRRTDERADDMLLGLPASGGLHLQPLQPFYLMVTVSKAVYASMGFRERGPDEVLSAIFYNVTVFELRGIELGFDTPLKLSDSVDGVAYRIALAKSVNAAAQCLLDEDLVENESTWASEARAAPPFLLIEVGPTSEHEATGQYIDSRIASFIHTYDSFRPAHEELLSMRVKVHSPLLPGMACAFNVSGNGLSLREVWSQTFGKTADGKTVVDDRIVVDGRGYAVSATPQDAAAQKLERAVAIAAKLDAKVHRVFYAALNERDPLKQFLFFFLTIERQTNASYASLNSRATLDALARPPDRVKLNASKLLERRMDDLVNLRDRFIWCSIHHWRHIDDADVDQFIALKKTRDDIAHGHITTPSPESLIAVERLAIKLQADG